MKIILGSQSPRRRELMAGLNIPFTTVTIHADESYPPDLQRGDIPIYISRAKARAYAGQLQQDDLLITADTIVKIDEPHTIYAQWTPINYTVNINYDRMGTIRI